MSEENTDALIKELQQKILYLREQAPKWIDADEPPESDETYMVLSPSNSEPIRTGYYDEGTWRSTDSIRFSTRITHYMKLPEPPEKE